MRDGCFVPVTPKAFELLLVLIRRSPLVVEKDELMQELWPDSFVEEGNLTQHVFALRRALGENHHEPTFIETVARRGYRFRASVTQLVDHETELIVEPDREAHMIGEKLVPVDEVLHVVGAKSMEAAERWFVGVSPHRNHFTRSWRALFVALIVATIFVAILVAIFIVRSRSQLTEAIDSIAVLPFVNTNADPNIEYLLDGLTESTINNLSQRTGLRVISITTASRYKGQRISPKAVASELGVRAVLTGEITRRDDTVIIHTELIDALSDSHLWSEQYTRSLGDILTVQDDISRQISSKLRLKLGGVGDVAITRYTNNAEAYQLYLKGRYFWNKRNEEGVRKGIDYLQQAIDADPPYALAYAGLADCYIVLGAPLNVLPPKEAFSKAKAAATKALAIDDSLAEAHAALGVVKQRFDWDPEGAAQEFRRAIELNPAYATAHQWYAINFEILGQADAAIAEAKRAYELDPLSIIINARLGHSYYFARRYDEAIEQYKKTLELDPNFAIAHSRLGWSYTQKGMYREAVEELLMSDTLSGKSAETVEALKQAFARYGMRGYWQKTLELQQKKMKSRYISAYDVALLHACLGNREQAFDWLHKAYEERSSALVYLKVEPAFDRLRSDPRFVDIVQRIHLA